MTLVSITSARSDLQDLTGRKFGRWIVVGYAGKAKGRKSFWLCQCECGTKRKVKADTLTSGTSKSCGCISRELRTTEPLKVRMKAYRKKWQDKHPDYRKNESKRWREADPVRHRNRTREWHYRQKYGMELSDVEQMLRDQGGKCAICRCDVVLKGRSGAALDHCHATNKVRGILCGRCNCGIGCLKDSVEVLEAAIAYLKN